MLGEKDLIYFGSIILYNSMTIGKMQDCIDIATEMYKRIFEEEKYNKEKMILD